MKSLYSSAVFLLLFTFNIFSDLAVSQYFTPYGLVNYRLRGKFNSQTDSSDNTLKQNLYSHQFGYFVGLKSKINDKLSLQFQIGNDWVNTETVTYKVNNNWNYSKNLFPYFHLAFATWDQGPFSLSFGKIPVESYGPLDLLERSIATNTYGAGGPGLGASFLGWITGTNNSLIGLKTSFPLYKQQLSISTTITYAIIDGDAPLNTVRGETLAEDPKSNPNEQLLVIDIPISKGAFTLTPQAFTVFNRNFNKNTGKGDTEFGAGVSAGLKSKNSKVLVRAKGGFATYNNDNTRKKFPVNDSISDLDEKTQVGFIGSIGSTIKVGPGTANFDFSISTDENTSVSGSKVVYPYIDVKYIWALSKNFDITPRARAFLTRYSEKSAIESKTWIWPELALQAKF